MSNPQTRHAYDAKISIQLRVLEWNKFRIERAIDRLSDDVARAESEHRTRLGELGVAKGMRIYREQEFSKKLTRPPPNRGLLTYEYVHLLSSCPPGILDRAWQDIAMLGVAHREELWASDALKKATYILCARRDALRREQES